MSCGALRTLDLIVPLKKEIQVPVCRRHRTA
jgi:hypothetical protein